MNLIFEYNLQYYNQAGENLTLDEVNTIYTLRLISSGLSIMGCLVFIIFYIIMWIKFRCNKDESKSIYVRIYTEDNSSQDEIDNSDVTYSNIARWKSEFLIKQNDINNINSTNRTTKYYKRHDKSNKMGVGKDLIFFMIICNLFWSMGSFLGMEPFNSSEDRDNPLCISQAMIQNYFDMSSICWNAIISRLILLGTHTTYSNLYHLKKKVYIFFLYSNLIPFVLTLGPYFTQSYGSAGVWCWIIMNEDRNFYNIFWKVCFYLFFWGHISYIIYALVTSSKYFSKRKSEIGNDKMKIKEIQLLSKYIIILRVFPVILVVTRLIATSNRIYYLITNEASFCLFCIVSVVYSLAGFYNAILYSYFYRSIFSCCKKEKYNDEANINNIDQNEIIPSNDL